MIKLPKEVNNIINTLMAKGFEAYAVGGCVRDSLLGETPLDWDLATNAQLEDLEEIFPDAKVLTEKYSVVRMDFTRDEEDLESPVVDVATFRVEGPYLDHRRPDSVEFVEDIKDDLVRRDFTINAMGDNPREGFVDPYNGKEDINKRLVRTIGNPVAKFKEDPIRILRAIRIAAEKDFDIERTAYEAMLQTGRGLMECSVDRVREEFIRIITAPNAGKGLRMLAGADLMPYIIGEKACKLNVRQRNNFSTLCDKIDKTQPDEKKRLGLFYTCLEGKKGEGAMRLLNYNNKLEQYLLDGLYKMDKLHFANTDPELKGLLVELGMERYEDMNGLAKAQTLVYGAENNKVLSRYYMVKKYRENGEPVFVEDLAIKGNDLIEAGICHGEEVGEMLLMLTDVVHKKPRDNTKETLLKAARKFKKSKFARATRKIKWAK
ncbi:MAG: hypothetical protein RR967_02415 [Anaerovoracaceae bacterium]